MYSVCRDCKYVCSCCSSRINNLRCYGCESHYDEFKPADNIKYCPLTGKKLSREGYTDTVGGYHEAGIEYSPTGEWCGECNSITCENCVNAKEVNKDEVR